MAKGRQLPKGRIWDWWGRRRRAEAKCLTAEITARAEGEGHSHEDGLRCFLEHRFETPLLRYGSRGPLYGRAFTFLSVAVVAAGFASSAISAADESPSDELRWILIALGLIVSLFTAINQLWKPNLRSVGSYRAGNALRREGWDFVNARGRYQDEPPTPQPAFFSRLRPVEGADGSGFDLFVDRIGEIQALVDAIDEVRAELGDGADRPDDGSPSN